MLEKELEEFANPDKFDTFLKNLIFCHTERCEHDDCSQFFFVLNLRYLYTEHTVKNYCRMQSCQFLCGRLFIRRLAKIEKQIIESEKALKKLQKYGTKATARCRPPTKPGLMTEKEFYEGTTVKKDDRYGLIFFILNTLNFIQGGDYYFYCENLIKKENDIVSNHRWKSGHFQMFKIRNMFEAF